MTQEFESLESHSIQKESYVGRLAVLCLAIFIVVFWLGLRAGESLVTDIPYQSGVYLPIALLLSYGFYAIVGKGGAGKFWIIFIAVYGTFVLTSVVNVQYQEAKLRSTLVSIADQTQAIFEESLEVESDGTIAQIEKRFVVPAGASGSMQEMMTVVADFVNDIVELQNSYLTELESFGLLTLLDANRLSSDKGFIESRYILQRINQAFVDYENEYGRIVADMPIRINQLALPEGQKQSMLEGFRKGQEKNEPLTERIFYLERQGLVEFEKIVDFLEQIRTSWYVENGQFMFETDEQVSTYNNFLANIDMYVAEQLEHQKKALQNQRETVENFSL
jgi:hypothetical protein